MTQISQNLVAQLALDLLVDATQPRTTRQSPLVWSGAPDWKKIIQMRHCFQLKKSPNAALNLIG